MEKCCCLLWVKQLKKTLRIFSCGQQKWCKQCVTLTHPVYSYLHKRAFMVVTSGTTWRNRWTIRQNTAPISFFHLSSLQIHNLIHKQTHHLPLSSSGRCSDSKYIPSLPPLKCNHIYKDPVVHHDDISYLMFPSRISFLNAAPLTKELLFVPTRDNQTS